LLVCDLEFQEHHQILRFVVYFILFGLEHQGLSCLCFDSSGNQEKCGRHEIATSFKGILSFMAEKQQQIRSTHENVTVIEQCTTQPISGTIAWYQ
jgi:hypothetical protein